MELRHLRYFVAVAEDLSFTKAAQKLRLAQPSLTRQVRNLEDEIGVRLLVRGNNRLVLTKEGEMFLQDSKKLLALAAESIVAVQGLSRGESARLNIGYVASVHFEMLPATLAAFRKLSPRVALNLFDLSAAEQLEALANRQIDLGFVGLGPPAQYQALESESVGYDRVVVALPKAHPLAKKASVRLTELAPLFLICMSAKTDPSDCAWVSEVCRAAGFSAKILQEAPDAPSAIRFVRDGLGVALVPEQIAGLPHEGVTFRPLQPALQRVSVIAWRTDNPSKSLQEYIRIVKELSAQR